MNVINVTIGFDHQVPPALLISSMSIDPWLYKWAEGLWRRGQGTEDWKVDHALLGEVQDPTEVLMSYPNQTMRLTLLCCRLQEGTTTTAAIITSINDSLQ